MADYDQFRVGATTFPLPSSTADPLLEDADPALYYALDFWAWVVEHYCGARFVAEAAAAGLTLASGVAPTKAVTQQYPYEPTPQFLENQVPLPSLFAWRTRGQSEEWTVAREHDLCGVTLAYVLPPLDAAQSYRLLPILRAIYAILRKKTSDAWDPGYTPPGGDPGDRWTDPAYANLEEAGFGRPKDRRVAGIDTGFEYGHLPGADNLWLPALYMRGYFTERDEYAPTVGGPSKFDGADFTANLQAPDGTVLPASSSTVARASTQRGPTITSLDVTTGPATGGTVFHVTGALFLSGPPLVYFGPASHPTYATSVTYVSPTSLTVTTPAMQGAGTVDLTVVNRDRQSATLPGAFAFT